jgi:hypothetical protein
MSEDGGEIAGDGGGSGRGAGSRAAQQEGLWKPLAADRDHAFGTYMWCGQCNDWVK